MRNNLINKDLTMNKTSNIYAIDHEEQKKTGYNSAKETIGIFSKYYQPNSIIDVGCGAGAWLKAWLDIEVKKIKGLDMYSLMSENLLISKENIEVINLNEYQNINDEKYDLVMSLEVAEHLQQEKSENFVKLLVSFGEVILFSAAIPHQPGTEHINCQPLKFWVNLFAKEGYHCFDILRKDLMESDTFKTWWYAQNILIFASNSKKELFEKQGFNPTKNPMFYYCPEHVEMLLYLAGNTK